MDLADQAFIGFHAATPSDAVRERERFTRGEHFENVFLLERWRLLQHFFDLEVAQAVSFNSRGPVNGPNPSTVPEPVFVLRIESEVVEEPTGRSARASSHRPRPRG